MDVLFTFRLNKFICNDLSHTCEFFQLLSQTVYHQRQNKLSSHILLARVCYNLCTRVKQSEFIHFSLVLVLISIALNERFATAISCLAKSFFFMLLLGASKSRKPNAVNKSSSNRNIKLKYCAQNSNIH